MAFSTSNVQTSYFGNMRITYGQWAETIDGDVTVGTITLGGGQVWLAEFVSQDSSGKFQIAPAKYSVSGTAGVLTLSVYNLATATNGRFLIVTT